MKTRTAIFIAFSIFGFGLIGCTGGEKAPENGDNPASANSTKATQEQINARNSPFGKTTNAPGTGRAGGNVMPPPK